MSKCHVRELNEVYAALFQDATHAYPTLGTEFERDLARLQRLVTHRGLPVYLVDLPAAGKHLDQCLAGGEYKLSGLPLTKRYSNRVVIPKFLRGLYLLVFNESGRLKEDYDVQAIFFLRQILYAAKKASVACSESKVINEVVEFAHIDSELPEPCGFWALDDANNGHIQENFNGFRNSFCFVSRVASAPPREREQLSVFLRNLDIVSGFLVATLGSYDPASWQFRHGPGAISEFTGRANKYSWRNWSERLEREFPIADYGYHSFGSWARDSHRSDSIDSSEPYSRLVAVPKSFSRPRLIAAEPSAHQWCQQNIWHYFACRCEASWINGFVRFRDQSLNQTLCTEGASSGSLCTVDLSAASDRVTCEAVGQMFRSNPRLLLALQACRTRLVRQRITDKVPEYVQLRKFSTMGSACTFPVESLMFLAITIAATLTSRGQRVTPRSIKALRGSVAVFGDDIIVPADSRELLFSALEVLYFKVNGSKSFWTGKFRESCGVDSFGGVDVTPAYWHAPNDGKPASVAMTVETSNNFYKKYLLATSDRIASTLPRFIPVVPNRAGVFGLTIRTQERTSGLATRWNRDLQRVEVRVCQVITKQTRTPVNDETALLQYFTEDPSPYEKWESGVMQLPLLKLRTRWVASSEFEFNESR